MALSFPNSPSVGDIHEDSASGFSYQWSGELWKSYKVNTDSLGGNLDADLTLNSNDITGTGDVDTTGNLKVSGIATASSFVKSNGTSSQFLKADGSVDSSTYITASDNITGTSGGLTGSPNITVTDISASGDVSIGGTLTYEDVSNVDSVGLVTARTGVRVTTGGIEVSAGGAAITGVVTATSFVGDITGNADTATTLETARNFSASGDATASSVSFNGSGDVDLALTLANSGVTAATYGSSSAIPSITVDAKGRITSATTSSIDSTSVSNGTASVSVASNGPITSTGNHDFTDGIDVTGNISVTGTVDGRDVATDGSKLDGIESGATADQTASEILTAIKTVDGSGSGLDADTVDGIQGASFLRSDTADTASGDISFSGGAGAVTISGNSDIRLTNGNWTGNHNAKIQHHNNSLYISGGSNGIIFREAGTDRAVFDGSGHFRPAANNTYDLGTSSLRWRNLYTNDLNLSNDGSVNDIDGTWGNYTIQEGENDLFLINRRNGKTYKFVLQEVS